MKNAVMIIVSSILGILSCMVVMTMYGRMNRSMELKSSLSSVVEETVENARANPKYSINNTEEFLAEITSALSLAIDSVSDVTVEIMKQDLEKGLLDIRVILSYRHPNGRIGTLDFERTVILNQLETEKPSMYEVCFLIGTEIYKAYQILEGDLINVPQNPSEIEGTFYGWKDESGHTAVFSEPISGNLNFYADIR